MTLINSHDFRKSLGAFATGVTVMTATDESNQPFGITVNSFTSVSLEPPLVSFCIDKKAHFFNNFMQTHYFGVNILNDTQRHLSNAFAHSEAQPWDETGYTISVNSVPKFNESLGFLECVMEQTHDAGDHVIIIGRVIALAPCDEGEPLIYFRGDYRVIGDMPKGETS